MSRALGPAWMFCPADRPERYPKALAQADVVILDLEDGVARDNKRRARETLEELAIDAARTVLRINAAATPDHAQDLAAAERVGITRLMLSKTESARDLDQMASAEVIGLVESPGGVMNAGEIARHDRCVGLMWGADDLISGLGGTSSRHSSGVYRDVARHARSTVLIAAKAHGLVALDSVYMDIADTAGLQTETEDAVAVGFDAKVAIHPSQLPVIRSAYSPDAAALSWAKRVLEAAHATPGVFAFEGQMVDGPIFKQAERILQRAIQGSPTGSTPHAQSQVRP